MNKTTEPTRVWKGRKKLFERIKYSKNMLNTPKAAPGKILTIWK